MAKRFVIYPDVSQTVQIAFTLTPAVNPGADSKDLEPIAFEIMKFPAKDGRYQFFEWYTELGFSLWAPDKGKEIRLEGKHRRVPPTHYLALSVPKEHRSTSNQSQKGSQSGKPPPVVWSKNKYDSELQTQGGHLIAVYNSTSEPQNVAIGCAARSPGQDYSRHYTFYPMACCRIRSGATFKPSVSMMLQAYKVQIKDHPAQRLQPEDLAHPIFSEPLHCDTLSSTSTWRLSESSGGKHSLREDKDFPDLESVASSLRKATELLNMVANDVSNLERRLNAVEKEVSAVDAMETKGTLATESISAVTKDVSAVKESVAAMGKEVTAVTGSVSALKIEVTAAKESIKAVAGSVKNLDTTAQRPPLPNMQSLTPPPTMHSRSLSGTSNVGWRSSGVTAWSSYNRREGPGLFVAYKRGTPPF